MPRMITRWHEQCRMGLLLVRVAARGPSLTVQHRTGHYPSLARIADSMPLDHAIMPLLGRLWALGMTTWGSCAGHWDVDDQRYTISWISMVAESHHAIALQAFVGATLGTNAQLPAGVRLNWGWEGPSYVQAPRIMTHGNGPLTLRIHYDRRLSHHQALMASRATFRWLGSIVDALGTTQPR